MILRSFHRLPTVLLSVLLLSVGSWADNAEPFNCQVTAKGVKFDLTPLAGGRTVNQTRNTPPTTTTDSLRFDLCDDLKQMEGIPEGDQCSTGTRACLMIINQKEDAGDRTTSVVPIARTSSLNYTYNIGLSSPNFISVIFNGPEYPHPINSTLTAQSLNITLFCDQGADSEPKFKSYDGAQVQVEWKTKSGCPVQGEKDGPKEGDNGNEPENSGTVGSGIGWFFLVLLLAFAGYFVLGAYYNYSNYGASGADLIPHRDFWKEVPYMLSDVVSHLCSSVRPRRSTRGGYIAV